MKPSTLIELAGTLLLQAIATAAAIYLREDNCSCWLIPLAGLLGITIQAGWVWAVRYWGRCLTLVVFLAASLQAQELSPPTTAAPMDGYPSRGSAASEPDLQAARSDSNDGNHQESAFQAEPVGGDYPLPVPGYQQPVRFSLALSMPQHPGEESPIIVGAICVGALAAAVGWIGIEIINKCLKVYEHQVTNAAPFRAQSETNPEPVPDPAQPSAQPSGVCVPCSAGVDADALDTPDTPLPILIETSPDGQTWSAAAVGLTRERFYIPDRGFWRASLMPLTITLVGGVATVHAPPGVLEFSPDLREWEVVGIYSAQHDLPAQTGFYRMRL